MVRLRGFPFSNGTFPSDRSKEKIRSDAHLPCRRNTSWTKRLRRYRMETMAFPDASQPDIARASLKDEQVLEGLEEEVQELARRTMGTRNALKYRKANRATTRLLYSLLTSTRGASTLGEEFCDLVQVRADGTRTKGWQRICLAFLRAMKPYAEEYATRGDWASPYEAFMKLHCALFYLRGTYHDVSMRLTGTRLAFVGQMLEERPSYAPLGVLLLLQLVQYPWSWWQAHRRRENASVARTDAQESFKVLTYQGEEWKAERTREGEDQDRPSTAQRCALCLARREGPTSTPCGHVFCWNCVVSWCKQKPECPLCRAPLQLAELVLVNHSDY